MRCFFILKYLISMFFCDILFLERWYDYGNSVMMDMAVVVEGGLTIVCSIFNIFDTEEQAKRTADILTKMGKGIFTYKEEMPL